MKNGFDFRIRINYLIFGLIFVVALGFFIFYFLYFKKGLEVKMVEVMAYATGSIAILTLVYRALNLETVNFYQKENLRVTKNQYSFEVISKVHSLDMGETIAVLRLLKDEQSNCLEEKNIKDFLTYLDENPDIRTKLSMLLNYFEHISLLVEKNHVDENIIKSAFKTLFTSTYSLLKFYIDERQLTHRRSWIKYEELAKKWAKE